MTAKSNLDEILKKIDSMPGSFAMNAPDPSNPAGKIGAGALDLVSQRIQARCRDEKAPYGNPWAPNKPWKQKHKLGKDKPVGILGNNNNMLAPYNITGTRELTENKASMTYGHAADEFTRRKAQWFTNGSKPASNGTEHSGAKNQAPRPFYRLDYEDKQVLGTYFKRIFRNVLKRLGGD